MAAQSVTQGSRDGTVIQFPAKIQRQAKHRMELVEIDARHSWMMRNRGKWETEATDGAEYDDPMTARLKVAMRERWPDRYPPLTAQKMRRDIAEGRRLIEKRNAVKAWLASLGVENAGIKDAEQALFAAFDKLSATRPQAGKQGAKT